MFESYNQKLNFFCILWTFSGVIPYGFGVLERSIMTIVPDTCLRALPKTRRFCILLSFSYAIAHIIGIPRRFTCLRVVTKNSCFLRFMAVFMCYFPRF